MIPRSPYIAGICLLLAGTLHAAVMELSSGGAGQITVQGGGGASIAILGNSFADMAKDSSVPKPETVPRIAAAEIARPRKDPIPAPAPEALVRPDTQPERKIQPAPKQTGSANRTARAGNAIDKEPAREPQAGPSQTLAALSGNAAVDNYPGQVIRHIQRTRRERINIRGSAQVSFTIASNGALAAVNITRSSGSERLDQVALQQIRRAAPFPSPPAGARRNFTLKIDGK